MSTTLDCNTSCCATPATVNTPGVQGQSAFTTTTADFVVPGLGLTVVVNAVNTDWTAVGQTLFIPGAGLFEVTNINSSTAWTLTYLNIASNVAAGDTIASGTSVVSGGSPGADGTEGGNAYTLTTANFVVPAVAASVAITVASSAWMTVGQDVFVEGAGYFSVDSKADDTHFTGTYLDVAGNTNTGNTVNAGAAVSPSGPAMTDPLPVDQGGTNSATATLARAALGVGGANLTVYAAGTVYSLTNTAALIDFGTTDPSLVITAPGVWLILARARIDYTGATFAAVRTGALKLRRTNNTAADVSNSPCGFLTDIITTLTYTLGTFNLPPVIYTTTNSDDIIQLWGSISTVPSAGTLDVSEASVVAIKLYDQTV